MSITGNTKKILLGVAGVCGAIAGIVALLTKVFGWDTDKTTAIVAIIVGIALLIGWGVDKAIRKVNKNLDERLDIIRSDIAKNEAAAKERSSRHDRALCRLELSDLLTNDPNNVIVIEKKAHHYFYDLNGNDGMGERYSIWAKEYNNGNIDVLNCNMGKAGE
jgi:hypothetical protein